MLNRLFTLRAAFASARLPWRLAAAGRTGKNRPPLRVRRSHHAALVRPFLASHPWLSAAAFASRTAAERVQTVGPFGDWLSCWTLSAPVAQRPPAPTVLSEGAH